MRPDHCKDVSFKEVDFPLTEREIARRIKGKKAYTRTEHYVLKNGEELAIVRVEKEDGVELFRPIINYDIVALPKDITYIVDDRIDVINPSQMAKVAMEHHGKIVVVQGQSNHVSFMSADEVVELRVLDVVPPRPAKLFTLVTKALASGIVRVPVVPMLEEIDLNDLAKSVVTDGIVFPCKASGLSSDKQLYFLDQVPEIRTDATLIGCDLSGRIHRSLYRNDIGRIDICPHNLAPRDGKKRIVKCCRVHNGHEIENDLALVPWGATVVEVAEAINALFPEPS